MVINETKDYSKKKKEFLMNDSPPQSPWKLGFLHCYGTVDFHIFLRLPAFSEIVWIWPFSLMSLGNKNSKFRTAWTPINSSLRFVDGSSTKTPPCLREIQTRNEGAFLLLGPLRELSCAVHSSIPSLKIGFWNIKKNIRKVMENH